MLKFLILIKEKIYFTKNWSVEVFIWTPSINYLIKKIIQ